ncbi:3D (Asp-Asp-Asp) domain-containing protein [Thalassobacillus cyri]|uniref:3D (Asp-Asp-Asp) domain-containing protein n=1 Tax=Thalassobacillus cyri TaxID=571932 RepID=A0A1H4FRR1_9BACI|nr:3D domain-containing protein [Thalassobacillus cyri]SEA99358.1 3D (Asp-Asp-Asp) domain-containing protein [Thalassobacillus cyri]
MNHLRNIVVVLILLSGITLTNEIHSNAETTNEKQVALTDKSDQLKRFEMNSKPVQTSQDPQGKKVTVEATAYTASCEGCTGITYTGIDLKANPGKRVIAVDPDVIPIGSKVHVPGYGTAIAGDIGGEIQGNRIDLFMADLTEAKAFGRESMEVTILN